MTWEFVPPNVLMIHSLKSVTSGMLGSAETLKIQGGVSENLGNSERRRC